MSAVSMLTGVPEQSRRLTEASKGADPPVLSSVTSGPPPQAAIVWQ